jgi:predicted nucleic acid-binding protein
MRSALVDTSFLITLADGRRMHHAVAWRYFEAFAAHNLIVYLSTIVMAEFSVRQNIEDLGLRHFIPLPFTPAHAVEAGRLQNLIQRDPEDGRVAVRDDLKLIAQCLCTEIDAVFHEDHSTLEKYLARARDQKLLRTRSVLLAAGFDDTLFNGGQASLPYPDSS